MRQALMWTMLITTLKETYLRRIKTLKNHIDLTIAARALNQ
jgi:hypothetical protein